MKSLIFGLSLTILLSSHASFAQKLKRDFSCSGESQNGTKFEASISDMNFAQELKIKSGTTTCKLLIKYAYYSERSAAPLMTMDLEKGPECGDTAKLQFIQEGFLKISLSDKNPEVHALILVGNDPIPCRLGDFNPKKLKKAIDKAFN